LRCLHLPSSYFPDSLGGTEVYVRELVGALRELGHASVIAWHTSSHVSAPSHALPPILPSRLALYTRGGAEEPAGFAELLDDVRPEIVNFHAFTAGAGIGHARLLQRRAIPYVITFHTPSMACPRGTWLFDGQEPCSGELIASRCAFCLLRSRGWPAPAARIAARSPLPARRLSSGPWSPRVALPSLLEAGFESWHEIFSGAGAIIACAELVRERLVRNGVSPERIEVLRQGLPGRGRVRSLRRPHLTPGVPLRIGFFGRVTHVKGPDLLVRAIEALRREGLQATLELVGPVQAAERAWLTNWLRGRDEWLRHREPLEGAELEGWLATRDLIAIPSRWFETGPLTLLEAWSAGVVAVGTDLGGIAEFMRPQGHGALLFPLDDVAGLAGAIRKALEPEAYPEKVTIPGMHDVAAATAAIYARAIAG